MDFSDLPSDYFAKSTQFTNRLYHDVYPSIDPSKESLSQKGKVILVTGASSGIGRHGIALSFAKAKADTIILAGRNEQALIAAAVEINNVAPDVRTVPSVVDICSEPQVQQMFDGFKKDYDGIDVLVNNAGSGESPLPITDVQSERWWYNFEVMVKGTFLMTQEFLKMNGKERETTIINITSAAALNDTPRLSSYSLSKLCQIQLQRFVRAENANVRAFSLHPGIVMTRMTPPAFHRFAKDTFDLVGGAAVWLASEQANFMSGRYMAVNWDVDELVQREEEIVSKGLLEVRLQGSFGNFPGTCQ